jgi:hypothetical protein
MCGHLVHGGHPSTARQPALPAAASTHQDDPLTLGAPLPPWQAGLVSFASIDAARFPAPREALGLHPDELPALAVISARRMRYALAPRHVAFSARGVAELIDGVLSGKVATAPLKV